MESVSGRISSIVLLPASSYPAGTDLVLLHTLNGQRFVSVTVVGALNALCSCLRISNSIRFRAYFQVIF